MSKEAKAERREKKRQNKRKMKVHGAGIKRIWEIIVEKGRKNL